LSLFAILQGKESGNFLKVCGKCHMRLAGNLLSFLTVEFI